MDKRLESDSFWERGIGVEQGIRQGAGTTICLNTVELVDFLNYVHL